MKNLYYRGAYFPTLQKKSKYGQAVFALLVRSSGLTDKTGTLDTLNKVFLAEEVYHYQGGDDKNTCCISDDRIPQGLTCVGCLQRNRHGLINIRHQICLIHGVNEEQGRVEVVRPLPREGEEEDGRISA